MKSITILALIFSLFAFCGCATMPAKSELITKPSVFPKPEKGTSLVYFYRESKFGGVAVSYYIYEGQDKIGALRSGNYFFHHTTPGKHTYWAETEDKASVMINCEPGKTYYIEGGVAMGVFIGNPKLTEVAADLGDKMIRELEYRTLVKK